MKDGVEQHLYSSGKIYMTTGSSTGFGIVKTSFPSVPSCILVPQFNNLLFFYNFYKL
jgi:hypothetical protein